jgi:hypothetical protein
MLKKEVFDFYILLDENNEMKEKAVHSFMTCYVHVLIYNATINVYMLKLRSFCN